MYEEIVIDMSQEKEKMMEKKLMGILDGLQVKNESLQKTLTAHYGNSERKTEIMKVH